MGPLRHYHRKSYRFQGVFRQYLDNRTEIFELSHFLVGLLIEKKPIDRLVSASYTPYDAYTADLSPGSLPGV